MQSIQLYIGTDRVEMFDDESVSITQSIKNVKDISRVFTTFTRQFTVPASKPNNKIFKHYYNYDIDNGFDARTRKDATIELNYLPFREGKLKLDGVDMRDNKPYAYRLTFFGSVVELKDILGEDKLPSLTALNIDFKYDPDSILDNLKRLTSYNAAGSAQDGYSLPLITHSQRLYYDSGRESEQSGNLYSGGSKVQGLKYNELKYAVRLDKIIAAIESEYSDINFASGSFFDPAEDTDIKHLYMWCHRKKGKLEDTSGTTIHIPFTGSQGYSFFTGNTFSLGAAGDTLTLTVTPDNNNHPFDLIINRNGTLYERRSNVTGEQIFTITDNLLITSGTYFTFQLQVYEQPVTADVSLEFVTTTAQTDTYSLTDELFDDTYRFNIQEQIPEMTIIDFLSSLFKMFNLVAYVDDNGDIDVQPLDTFYQSTEHDISKYVDVNKSAINSALPYKEIFFKYADTGTILAKQHLQQIAQVEWGGNEYTNAENLDGEIYKVEPNFHHAKYEKLLDSYNLSVDTGIQVGYFVDDNEEAYLGKPLLLFINAKSASKNINFVKLGETTEITTSSTLNMPTNLKTIDNNSSNNIHFDVERNEYTNSDATATLFSRFYNDYIENVFNEKNRLTKVTAVLPVGKIINIELSDIVVINGRKYRINSMNTSLKDGRTDFELINYYA